MAGTSAFVLSSQVIIFILLSHFASALANTEDHVFGRSIGRELVGLNKEEKLSHFRFYWHDIVSGHNPTSVQVVDPVNSSSTAFGMVNMIDNPLTAGPKLSSKMVGRAQGFYTSASLQDISLLMAMNFAFTDGKYNGSSLTILGRNPIFNQVREMPVIGGSGLFRFAKGYAQAKTYKVNLSTKDAIVEYNVYVMHY